MSTKTAKRPITPEGLKLRPFQKQNLKKALRWRRWLLTDEMGLGKTCQSIVMCNIRSRKKIVVICPASLRLNWKHEFKMWDTMNRSVYVINSKNPFEDYAGEDVLIMSYHAATRVDILRELSDYTLLIDEVHACKNWAAARTRAVVMNWSKKSTDIIAMTGTPILKHIPDLHPVVSMMRPGEFGKFKDFCGKYTNEVWDGFQLKYYGVKNEDELKARLAEFMTRNLKADVLKDLPDKSYIDVPIEISAKVAAESMKYVAAALKSIGGDGGSLNSEHIAVARRELGEAKIKPTIDYVTTLNTGCSGPIVLFAHHRSVLQGLRIGLEEKGLRVGMLIGGMSDVEKDAVVRKFQGGELDVFVGSIMAASVGLTLTASSEVVFAELDWTPAIMAQAVDRVHRIGQDRGVQVHMLVGEDSLDQMIVEVLESKMRTINKVMT